jgi:hypothetical protein
MPNVSFGVDRPMLANIMKCFDLYLQPTIAAGREMPIWEAAACGVQGACMAHSALNDAIKYIYALPIKIAKQFLECETAAYRVMVDNDDMMNVMYNYFMMPLYKRKQLSMQIRDVIVKRFTWDHTAKIWANYIDNHEHSGLQGKWYSPPRLYHVPDHFPDKLSNEDFITWIYNDLLHQPQKRNGYAAYKLASDLTFGVSSDGGSQRINREVLFHHFRSGLINHNYWEQVRCGMVQLPDEDWLEYARIQKQALLLKPEDIIE